MFGRAPMRRALARLARISWSCQLLLAAIITLALAAPAAATQPQPQQFETIGSMTGPNTAAGTWIGTGLVEGTGTYTETFRFAGKTIHGTKVLVSPSGTIVLQIRNIVVFLDACTVEFKAGSWRISEATGAYARLKGRGAPGTTAKSVNVCTGFIDVVHVGTAHYD
jgi:hypothetical protein